MALPSTTDAGFAAAVLSSPTPVLVDFTAGWCPPCQELAPVLEQFVAETQFAVVSLDVDENPVTADLYQVTKLPTLVLFVGGRPTTRLQGRQTLQTLRAELPPDARPPS